MGNLSNYISYIPKQITLGMSLFAIVFSAVMAPIAMDSNVLANTADVRIEADTKVANVTAGDTSYSKNINAKVDEVVKVQVWYHNMENWDSGKEAKNLRVAIDIPSEQGKQQTITGTVSADNSNTVNSAAQVNLSLDRAYLEYIPGSANWRHNQGAADGREECITKHEPIPADDPNNCYTTDVISDQVVSSNGFVVEEAFQPSFEYQSTITVLARVKADVVSINKYVRHLGDSDWKVKNSAKPADKLEYLIQFKNEGNTVLENVIVGDNLPDYLSYVAGTTMLRNGNHPDGIEISSDNVTTGGINVGAYSPGSVGYVWFQVKVDEHRQFAKCGTYTLKNVGIVRPEGMNDHYNTAHTDVKIKCEEKPEQPEKPERPEQPEKPDEEFPDELPVTGFGGAAAGLLGSGMLGIGVRSWLTSRRKLLSSLLDN